MLLLDRAPITSRTKDARGFLTCAARVSRTGVQRYTRQELGIGGAGVVSVYRPPLAIFSDASLQSFEGALVTAGHPPGGVCSRSWRHWSIGHVVGPARKAEDGRHVAATLQIVDSSAVAAIEGGLSGLSVEYTCSLRHDPGTAPDGHSHDYVQGDVTVDHVAVVAADQARCGPTCAIADAIVQPASACACGGACVAPSHTTGDAIVTTRTIIVDGQPITTDARAADLIEALIARLAALHGQQPMAADAARPPARDWLSTAGRAPEAWRKNLEDLHRATRHTRAA